MDARDKPAPKAPDFGRTAEYYARYRPDMPAEFFDALAARGVGLREQRLVDVGCGTGLASRRFALAGCRVTGVDLSHQLIDQAKLLDAEAGVSVAYRVATAEETGLQTGAYDVLTAFTCWHYFDHDSALAEACRILKPGGRVAVVWYYWLAIRDSVVAATEALVLKHNPSWKHAGMLGLPQRHVERFTAGGLRNIETFSIDRAVAFTQESWRLRMMSCGGVGACLDDEAVRRFDVEHEAMLRDQFPTQLEVPYRSFALVGDVAG